LSDNSPLFRLEVHRLPFATECRIEKLFNLLEANLDEIAAADAFGGDERAERGRVLEEVVEPFHAGAKAVVAVGQLEPVVLFGGDGQTGAGDVELGKFSISFRTRNRPRGQREGEGGNLGAALVDLQPEQI